MIMINLEKEKEKIEKNNGITTGNLDNDDKIIYAFAHMCVISLIHKFT